MPESVECQHGYVCTNTNLCKKINQTNDEYEQVDFSCPAGYTVYRIKCYDGLPLVLIHGTVHNYVYLWAYLLALSCSWETWEISWRAPNVVVQVGSLYSAYRRVGIFGKCTKSSGNFFDFFSAFWFCR